MTFTRLTALTYHQSHHTGTIEEAQHAVEVALASRPAPSRQSKVDEGSPGSPTPGSPRLTMSPGPSLPPIPNMHRQGGYPYTGNSSMPLHVRQDLQYPFMIGAQL